MATIAGGVLAIYMSLLGSGEVASTIAFGKHLLTASILSAPAALVVAKMIVPQTEVIDAQLSLPQESPSDSLLDAATKGASDGLKLALNVGAMLIAFTALVRLLNYLVGSWIGSWTGLNEWVARATGGAYDAFDFSFLIGAVSAPFAWLMGTPNQDLLVVGQLLGERLVLNEFYAYVTMSELTQSGALVHERSVLICTYALCGFANLTSIGIHVGGISALEPSQRPKLLRYGMKALLGGMIACYVTAIIASNLQLVIG